MRPFPLKNTRLMVCDMAGTVINEKGIIYNTIEKTLKNMGFETGKKESWYGRDKKEILYDEIRKNMTNSHFIEDTVNIAEKELIKELENEYFSNTSEVKLMHPDLPILFERLRYNGIKMTLNTGYPTELQEKIIKHFDMTDYIDDFISCEDVIMGRPAPYMIHHLMERQDIMNPDCVVKIGDTNYDILEGKNAKCGLTVGVLSGVGTIADLNKADIIIDNIMSIENFECDERYLF
jgi:phosphonatase-like hydrolase